MSDIEKVERAGRNENAVRPPLARQFGSLAAVDGLTLSVQAGEVLGLLGRNGAGKTTVIKMLTTLLPPSDGSAAVCRFDIVRGAASVRRIIGYVPQALLLPGFAAAPHLGRGIDLLVRVVTLAALVTVSAKRYPHIAR